jgi:triphosphoribosyl-dephospho-CoA synthase
VAAAGQLACLLEVSAPKPGSVSPGRHFHDTRYEDFLASAVAIGPALSAAGTRPLGATIFAAVDATARWTRSNTNMGIVLLLVPLARAAQRGSGTLRDAVREVLAATTSRTPRRSMRRSGGQLRRAGRRRERGAAARPR